MQIEKYETESTVSSLIFTFESVGERIIKKRVIYSKFENPNDIERVYYTLLKLKEVQNHCNFVLRTIKNDNDDPPK